MMDPGESTAPEGGPLEIFSGGPTPDVTHWEDDASRHRAAVVPTSTTWGIGIGGGGMCRPWG